MFPRTFIRPKWLAALAIISLAYFATVVVVLQFLRTDYNPVTETLSQYAVGPYGQLMTVGFFVLGVGVVALAVALKCDLTSKSGIASACLVVTGIGIFLVGIFPVDREPGAMPPSEAFHHASFFTSLSAAMVAMFLVTHRFRVDGGDLFHLLRSGMVLVAFIELALFVATYDSSLRGLSQKLWVVTGLLWLLLTSIRLLAVAHVPLASHAISKSSAAAGGAELV